MRGEVLVTIMNKPLDMAILREKGWYRIPIGSAQRWIRDRWPPRWLAFYQTKAFGGEGYTIRYFAEVMDIRKVQRWELFPDQIGSQDDMKWYYQILVKPIQQMQKPIYSRKQRRIIFIPTTLERFQSAHEINDLYDGSSLENKLWAALKFHNIPAEREEFVIARKNDYALDFAIYCAKGNLAIEVDGDFWHANPVDAGKDNLRENDLKAAGWQVLRFNEKMILEEVESYCISTIRDTINTLGGVDEGRAIPRKINPGSGSYQLSLFDGM